MGKYDYLLLDRVIKDIHKAEPNSFTYAITEILRENCDDEEKNYIIKYIKGETNDAESKI